MGMTLWVNIRDGAERYSNQEDHSAMLTLRDELDNLAQRLNVQKLSDFYDYTEIEIELKLSVNSIDNLKESFEETWDNDDAQWFSPETGIATLTALLKHLEQTPQSLDLSQSRWDINDLIDELQNCKIELMQAMEKGHPFHFCMVD
jgi:uncharacterized protein YerC